MKLIFDDSLKTSVSDIDDQHKEIFDKINSVINCKINNENEIRIAVSVLHFYVERHFQDEEMLLSKHGIPNLDEHTKHHSQFIESLKTFMDEINSADLASISLSRINFLFKDWWISHINEHDKPFADFLLKKCEKKKP